MTELEHHRFDIPNKLINLSFRQEWLLILKKNTSLQLNECCEQTHHRQFLPKDMNLNL